MARDARADMRDARKRSQTQPGSKTANKTGYIVQLQPGKPGTKYGETQAGVPNRM